MNELFAEIQRIVKEIENASPSCGTVQSRALKHLKDLHAAVESGRDYKRQRENALAGIRHFWFNDVPWCSQLSKDLEKVIIMADDVL